MKDFIKSILRESLTDDNYSTYKGFMKPYVERKKEFMNSIKSFMDISDDNIPKIIDYFGYEGFNDEEEGIDYLKEKISEYKNFNNPQIMYRIVAVKNKKLINTKDLGEHYTPNKWNIDGDFLLNIGQENWDSTWIPYIMEVSVPLSEIDVWQTIIQNLSFPYESEINLKNKGNGAKLIKVYKYK